MQSFTQQIRYLEEVLNYKYNGNVNDETTIIGHTYIQNEIVFLVRYKSENNIKVKTLNDLKKELPSITIDYLKNKLANQ